MMAQHDQTDTFHGVSTELAAFEKAFNSWSIESNDAPQAIFTGNVYGATYDYNTLMWAVYATPGDHPAVGSPEAWSRAFEDGHRIKTRHPAALIGQGLCGANPADGRITGMLILDIATLTDRRPAKINDPVYVNWLVDKLRWLWQQAFTNKAFPTIRMTEFQGGFDEVCRAEYPCTRADECLALLLAPSPEKRYQGMVAFLKADDREWLSTIFRTLWHETDPRVIDAAFEVIAHFQVQHDLAVYFVKQLSTDIDRADRLPDEGRTGRDINILRRLGTAAVPVMLADLEHPKGGETYELLNILIETGDARVKPALEALLAAQTKKDWLRQQIKVALEKLIAKPK